MSGKLVLVATPIGHLGDLSPRAVDALTTADFWIVEDTRVSGKLQAHLGLKRPMRILNDHTGQRAVDHYCEEISAGATAALVTDGGNPAISDPGARLTDLCREQDVEVDAIPGPSAVTTALMLSGFYAQRFAFLGFLPRKAGAIRSELQPFAESTYTLVLFESALRADSLLESALVALGPRRYAICREMTKLHQQVWRGRLSEIPEEGIVPRKGEWTVVIEGRRRGLEAEHE